MLILLSLLLQLVFEDLLERVKEKEEKEAKKLQRLAEDFNDKLSSIKVCGTVLWKIQFYFLWLKLSKFQWTMTANIFWVPS